MLASPIRQCRLTKRYLPSGTMLLTPLSICLLEPHIFKDFLIRLIGVRYSAPDSRKHESIAVPDGVEHPRFKNRLRGQATYVLCRKECVRAALDQGDFTRPSSCSRRGLTRALSSRRHFSSHYKSFVHSCPPLRANRVSPPSTRIPRTHPPH